jgi:hypothetical protein
MIFFIQEKEIHIYSYRRHSNHYLKIAYIRERETFLAIPVSDRDQTSLADRRKKNGNPLL